MNIIHLLNDVLHIYSHIFRGAIMITCCMLAFYLFFPALAIYLCGKYSLFNRLGAVVICYIFGILSGNIGMLPADFFKVQDAMMTMTVPIALPLLFFSLDVKKWSRLAGKSILSFALQTLAIIIIAAIGFFIFRDAVGDETWKIAGMFIGVYTGGTVNLAAIGTALHTTPTLYIAAHASDVVVSSIYLLFLMTAGRKLFLKVLPPFKPAGGNAAGESFADFESYAGIFKRDTIVPIFGALALSILIFAIGGGLSMIVPKSYGMVAAILTITTLGILCSFIPKVRNIKMTYQAGNYFILIFCLVVGSMANLGRLLSTAPVMLLYVTFTIFVCLLLHVSLSSIFKIDTDTVIITSVAGICSPPLVPMVASALKNKEIVISGVITGIIGWVEGTYLGITFAYILHNVFF